MREGTSKARRQHADDIGGDVVRAIVAAHEAVVAAPVRRVAAAGFDDVTPAILAAMLAIPVEGIDLADLRRMKGRSKQSASQIVEELRRRGYVVVKASAVDGRAKVVVPTGRGLALLASAQEAGQALARTVADVMGDDAAEVASLLLSLAGMPLTLSSS